MKSLTRSLLAALVAASLAGTADAADLENTLYMDLKDGRVVIEMRPDLAPKHVAQIKRLTRKGFYDGLVFHRVIEGFMVQGGDPDGNGTGGSGTNIPAEFSDEQHLRGVMSMARSRNPDSADSQFFIMLAHTPHLDGAYTIWGKVTNGMKYVDNIKKGDSRRNGSVDDPDKIVRMRVAADVK
jgi:peptidylprolyl isomerase